MYMTVMFGDYLYINIVSTYTTGCPLSRNIITNSFPPPYPSMRVVCKWLDWNITINRGQRRSSESVENFIVLLASKR